MDSVIQSDDRPPDPIDVAVGLRLRELRRSKGVSQDKLGAALGITFQQVQKYERGTNRISASMLVKAALALGVAPTSLLPEDDAPAPRSPAILGLIASLRGVEELVFAYAAIRSPRLRRTVLLLARALAGDAANRPE